MAPTCVAPARYTSALSMFCALFALLAIPSSALEAFCPESTHPDPRILYCDDFDSGESLRERYLRFDDGGGSMVLAPGAGRGGSRSLLTRWTPGQVAAGGFTRTFGRAPVASLSHETDTFSEVYWRVYLRTGPGWEAGSSRWLQLSGLASKRWAQAFTLDTSIVEGSLALSAASGVLPDGSLRTTGFRDWQGLWVVGQGRGDRELGQGREPDVWRCVEVGLRLNRSGASDGDASLWIDGRLVTALASVSWVQGQGPWGVNALSLDNTWEGGAPGPRERHLDDLAIGTERIGCGESLGEVPSLGVPGKPVLVGG